VILTNPDLSWLRDGVIALRDLFLIGPFRSIAEVVGLLNLSALSASFVLWSCRRRYPLSTRPVGCCQTINALSPAAPGL